MIVTDSQLRKIRDEIVSWGRKEYKRFNDTVLKPRGYCIVFSNGKPKVEEDVYIRR